MKKNIRKFNNLNLDIPKMSDEVKQYVMIKAKTFTPAPKKSLINYFRMAIPCLAMLIVVLMAISSLPFQYQDTTAYTLSSERQIKQIVQRSDKLSTNRTDSIINCASESPKKFATNTMYEAKGEMTLADNDAIYTVMGNSLVRFDIATTTTKNVSFDTDIITQNTNLYLTEDYLLAISYSLDKSFITVYQKDDLTIMKSLSFKGTVIYSAMQDNYFYFITNTTSYDGGIKYQEDDQEIAIPFGEIRYLYYAQNECCTVITSINLGTLGVQAEAQLGSYKYDTIFLGEERLYLVSSKYYASRRQTASTIYAYDIGETLEYYQALFLFGTIKNETFIDEYQGYLRLVLIDINDLNNYNKLLVFDQQLNNISNVSINNANYPVNTVWFDEKTAIIVCESPENPSINQISYIEFVKGVMPRLFKVTASPLNKQLLHKVEIGGDYYYLGLGFDGATYELSLYQIDHNSTIEDAVATYSFEAYGDGYRISGIDSFSNVQRAFIDYVEGEMLIGFNMQGRFVDDENYLMLRINPQTNSITEVEHNHDGKINQIIRIEDFYYFVDEEKITKYSYQDGKMNHVNSN